VTPSRPGEWSSDAGASMSSFLALVSDPYHSIFFLRFPSGCRSAMSAPWRRSDVPSGGLN
jgi:hypothetical protein